jgi:excisionase family DNA binding protein
MPQRKISRDRRLRQRRFADLPELCTPADLIAYLPVGRDAVYAALKSQKIRNIRVGQKIIVPKAAVREFLGGSIE